MAISDISINNILIAREVASSGNLQLKGDREKFKKQYDEKREELEHLVVRAGKGGRVGVETRQDRLAVGNVPRDLITMGVGGAIVAGRHRLQVCPQRHEQAARCVFGRVQRHIGRARRRRTGRSFLLTAGHE